MYFIAYSQGRRVCDGYAPTAHEAAGLFPGRLELESTRGSEEKWSDTSAHPLACVVYVRPQK